MRVGKRSLELLERARWLITNEISFTLVFSAEGSASSGISRPRMVELSGNVTISTSYG